MQRTMQTAAETVQRNLHPACEGLQLLNCRMPDDQWYQLAKPAQSLAADSKDECALLANAFLQQAAWALQNHMGIACHVG